MQRGKNVDLVNDLLQSQEHKQLTHRTVREISRETCIRLRLYKITTMSLVAAFYWNTIIICKNATNFNIEVSQGSAATCFRYSG